MRRQPIDISPKQLRSLLLALAWTVTSSVSPVWPRPAAEIPCLTNERNELVINLMSPHWTAAMNESPEALMVLLEAGADPNARHIHGWTLLHCAAKYNGSSEALQVLLDAGADPNTHDEDGFTPLHRAAQSNTRIEVLQVLLDAGADPNALTETGWTPLDLALARHVVSPGMVKTLLDAGGIKVR